MVRVLNLLLGQPKLLLTDFFSLILLFSLFVVLFERIISIFIGSVYLCVDSLYLNLSLSFGSTDFQAAPCTLISALSNNALTIGHIIN